MNIVHGSNIAVSFAKRLNDVYGKSYALSREQTSDKFVGVGRGLAFCTEERKISFRLDDLLEKVCFFQP